MRLAPVRLVLVLVLAIVAAAPARAVSDAALIDGFRRTVFGAEYSAFAGQAGIVKKFVKPVRLYVDDRSRERRGADVARFARSLPGLIQGLRLTVVDSPSQANFRVVVTDRRDYRAVVASAVYGRRTSVFAPGKCLVRIVSAASGIIRSDAVIVADEGERLFSRCVVEEVLQGLGPVNDDRTLSESVFNDRSRHSGFTPFDRGILNMLYDPRVRPGMSEAEASRVLPAIAADVRARLR